MTCYIIQSLRMQSQSTSRLYCSLISNPHTGACQEREVHDLNLAVPWKENDEKSSFRDGAYLLSTGLAATALPPVAQTVTTASILVGLNILFGPARFSKRSAQLTLLLSQPRRRRGRWDGFVGRAHRVQPSVFFPTFWPLFTTLGFLNNFLQNKESILCLSRLLDNTLHHLLLVAHGSEEIQWENTEERCFSKPLNNTEFVPGGCFAWLALLSSCFQQDRKSVV